MGDLNVEQARQTVTVYGTDSSGNLTNPIGSDANLNLKVIDFATSATGSAVSSDASFIGGKNPSGNLVGLITDASSNLFVNIATSVLPTGASTSANQTTEIASLQLIDNPVGSVGAGTAGTSSYLIGGVFNTALPTLTTGQQSAIQLDSSGRQIIAPLTNVSVVKAQLEDNAGNGITSSSTGTTPNQLLHTQTPDTQTASTALGALNAAVSITMAGLASAGFQITAGTLIGTITPECSIDGGTTWAQASFYDPSNSTVSTTLVFGSANTTKVLSVLPIGGSSNVRVRVSAYTSGTANALLRASQVTGAAGAVTAAAFGTVINSYIALTANTTTQLLAANSNRKYAYISNNSGGLIAIQFGSATGLTTAARGLVIPNGNYYELKGDNLYTGAVFAFTNSSGLTVAVTEGTP